MNKIVVSQSPHQLGNQSVQKLMYGVLIALIPTFAVSVFYFGLGAIVIILTSILASVAFEYLITKLFLKREPTITDGSAVITGALLAFNLPSNTPIWLVIIGALVAIGIGKMTFGGLGNNPFNPALVGRVFLLISFPVHMTTWPKPSPLTERMLGYTDVTTGATPLGILQSSKGGVAEVMDKIPRYSEMFLGQMGGSAGEIGAAAILIGLVYMLVKRIITWHIPVAVIGSTAILSGILWVANPAQYVDPLFHLFAGGLMLGAVFMATDYATSPMSEKGMLVYGAGIGILTVVIRVFGAYPEGVSFAILLMNAVVPILNMYLKPKRFGEVKKKK